IKRDFHEAAYNWGIALDDEAEALAPSDPPTARSLWQAAGERYRQVLEIKRDFHDAANNWGIALIHEYHALQATDPEAAKSLLNQALLRCQEAEAIKPGAGAYNLACIAALNHDVRGCIEWLNTSRRHGSLPSAEHLREDRDLDWVREQPDFQVWWDDAFGKDDAGAA
ncbi:MAG: hypothetical protein LLG15_00685, partial [Betaproteobacteria bacterium]|nr:hypothetical protein [Betaproteobacteria bacterium]